LSKEAHVKQILGKVCRASVAAAGVVVAASAASAESRPLELETEFDLGHVGGSAALDPSAPVKAAALDVSSAVGNWQESIGSYLEGLLADRTPGVQAAAPEVKDEAKRAATVDADEVIEEEIAAFKPAEPVKAEPQTEAKAKAEGAAAVSANPLLLAPVLSHPMDCPECDKLIQQAAAEDAADAESRVDDEAAWQNLADWAGSRVADAGAAAATAPPENDDVATAESAFFDDAGDPTLAD
jgi:hypothetical protein